MRMRVAAAEQVLHGDDRSVVDIELSLFGVFDGVGSIPDSDRAADLAARTITRVCRNNPEPSLDALMAACDAAQEAIVRSHLGATTATVAWIESNQLNYVSIGDSRLYLLRGGKLRQITQDQGEGNLLENVLGELPPPDYESLTQQNGTFVLEPGDKLILVTDGVTGDFAPDLLSLGEIEAAVAEDKPQAAAENLIQAARKHDDRTAVVVFVDGG
jgi:PPM family protein phosphatase